MVNIQKNIINKISRVVLIFSAILGIIAITLEYGFNLSQDEEVYSHLISIGVVSIFILYQFVQVFISENRSHYIRTHKIEFAIILFIAVEFFLSLLNFSLVQKIGAALHVKNITLLYIVFAQVYIVLGLFLSGLRYNLRVLQSELHPSRIFVLSFLISILVGTSLLMLPASTVNGHISIIDALFTSTSAVCVTGLITVDTATYFTPFGQIIIMGLFQIGGLGLMTFTTFFAIFLSGGLGLKERILLHDLLNEENISAIAKVLAYLLITTFIIEAIGALLLFQSIHTHYNSISDAVFYSVFHSISAFCNAGFSIFSLNLMDPLVKDNYMFTTTISILIIFGGLGFPTILGIIKFKNLKSILNKISIRVPLQSKIVLLSTFILIIFGGILTYVLEYDNTLKGMDAFHKIHNAYFQSVTSRTAGFNTIDFGVLSTSTSIIYLFLMFVGASPGGTGGGLKTTTFFLVIASIWSILRDHKQVRIGNRSISNEIVVKAFLKLFLSIFIIILGIFILSLSEQFNLLDLSFEAFSAFGTVGLSRGITGTLTVSGKMTIILLMFIGRIGPLAFIYSIIKTKEKVKYELPNENISIL